jgi:hypothetical protein
MRASILIVMVLVLAMWIPTLPPDELGGVLMLGGGLAAGAVVIFAYYIFGCIIWGIFKWAKKQ